MRTTEDYPIARVRIEYPVMKWLDGEELSDDMKGAIASGQIECRVIGFCTDTGLNVVVTGDALFTIHSSDLWM